jgi:hypothetical protein
MQSRSLLPAIALLTVTAIATAALAFGSRVVYTGRAGVHLELPSAVGPWRGERLFSCQNPACGRNLVESELAGGDVCPVCGGALSSGSRIEWALLPADTVIRKTLYTHADTGEQLAVSMVLGGESRTSIHRPQICLVGDGREITRTRSLGLRESGGHPLTVTLLDLLWRGQLPDGRWVSNPSFYAYWFIAPNRQTARHDVRMFWMAFDRIVRGESHRWAYIGVAGRRTEGADAHEQRATDFIAQLAPAVRAF